MKRNDGFTLVELMVGIVAASIVTLAASTALLMGLRMQKASSDTATRQNNARIVLTVLEDLAAEKNIKLDPNPAAGAAWKVLDGNNAVLFSFKNSAIYIGDADSSTTPLMEAVQASASLDGDLLKLELTTEDDAYSSAVYCRVAEAEPTSGSNNEDSIPRSLDSLIAETKLEASMGAREHFLGILTAELGSTGASLATGEYFSEWYIGSYEDNPAWDENTPWCACFLSWALDQCGEDIQGRVPKYANVDAFLKSFDRAHWKTSDPDPGDVIFFDWNAPYDNPEHVGAVTAVRDGYVYTVEGNSNGKVEEHRYAVEDPRILGYGSVNWN